MDTSEASRPERIRRRLLEFYDRARRELPWRGEEDPYRIWVSEVMLQQTRVETVVPYYRRWLERFPTVEALAEASREEVLQLWKGLGYYSRARNLHEAAAVVRDRFDGELPETVGGLEELPGIGPYTAGAVASIAFDVPAPAVDGNARRVLSRLFDLADPGGAELRERAGELVDPRRPGDFNQALMELGARVCTPTSPACAECPVGDLCLARARGTVGERPPPRKRTPPRTARAAVAVLADPEGCTAVRRRPEDGLLGGMWEFPAAELADEGGDGGRDDGGGGGADGPPGGDEGKVGGVAPALRAAGEAGLEPELAGVPRALEPVRHAFTHLKVEYRPYLIPVAALSAPTPPSSAGAAGDGRRGPETTAVRVLPLEGLDAVPLSVAQQKIAAAARSALAREGDLPPE